MLLRIGRNSASRHTILPVLLGRVLVIIIGHFIAKKKRAEHEANLKLHRIDRSSAETAGKEA